MQRFRGIALSSDGADTLDDLRPSFAHVLERKIVLRRVESGMHHANPNATLDLCERPGDNGLQTRAIPGIGVMSASPRVDQAFVRRHLKHLAMDDAVPFTGRRGLESEVLSFHRLEARRHHEKA